MDNNRTETAFREGEVSYASPVDEGRIDPEFAETLAMLDVAQETTKAPQYKPGEMPSTALAAAGLTVFDSILIVVFLGLWSLNPEAMLAIIKTMAGITLLLAVAPIVIGGLILHTNKQTGTVMPGTPWASVAMIVGTILGGLTLAIPLLTAVRMLLIAPPDGS
jgi:hypothetical protein